ncbi:hypothetical protein D1818_09640 [Aquimarina sp. BL5]|uniref:DUF6799 domain-containing protein n=1 Tax=Aquimarina sp. BL5 TaxID=1714860 RepID=UPI000E46D200|nr:DUF6799 domain-containing protein [Aquimarina sp. BL5]AXT51075.1 hypothetical protein D1818_09640 [Aquimarina sp. BL5]RKN02842.1 hypothetical protein D7036_15625 [Aquimarina sp. BL5]
MRKLILFFGLLILGTVILNAQNQDPEKTMLMYVDGDMLQVIDGDITPLQESIILQDCRVLNSDGSFKAMDGYQSRLKEGECMDMYGIEYRNEYQYRYKTKKENKGLTQTQLTSKYQNKLHYIKISGKVYQVTNISQKPLRDNFDLANGVIVDPYGIYKESGKEQIRLIDGDCINLSGVKFENSYDQRKILVKKIKKTNNEVQ